MIRGAVAKRPGRHEREDDRIVETVGRHRHEDAAAVTESLLEAVRGFAGEAPQSDDITLMTLRFLAPS
jgi:sigma-B regulation protein RsbU (phosphoserine phosphatase)